MFAREQIRKIDSEWLVRHVPAAALERLDLNDEWEYRRLLEAIGHIPALKSWAVALGKASKSPEIVEASDDYANKTME